MREKIAESILVNVQRKIDNHIFFKGKPIIIAQFPREKGIVPDHIRMIYKNIHKGVKKEKTFHSSLCKIVEIIVRGEKNRKKSRHFHDQAFYDRMGYNFDKLLNVNLIDSVHSILGFVNLIYPEQKPSCFSFFSSPPSNVLKIRKLMNDCIAQEEHPRLVWGKIKEAIHLSYKSTRFSLFNSRKENYFMKSMREYLVFSTPKKIKKESFPLFTKSQEEEATMIAAKIEKTIRKRSNRLFDTSTNEVEVFYKEDEARIRATNV